MTPDARLSGPKTFFAYGGKPPLTAEAMRDAVSASRRRGVDASSWEGLKTAGNILLGTITGEIDASSACIAEVGTSNPNVLFEAGYALAKGKRVIFALDETDQDALRNWNSLSFIQTIGRIDYSGNPETLADKLAVALGTPEPPLIESLLSGARPTEANAVFAPGSLHKFNTAMQIEKCLQRKTYLKLIASEEEVGLAPLNFYVEEIYRSSAAILHFNAPKRLRSTEYNSRLALLAGITHGLGRPLLMLAEEGYTAPLDYKDLLYTYTTSAGALNRLDKWLDNLPTQSGSNKRLGRFKLDIEMPIATFGQFVAEQEEDQLTDYFVPTNEFQSVLDGAASVFIGRKGTGKSATMQQAVAELRKDRRNLVVPIKPSSYELAQLIRLLDRFTDTSKREYFLVSLWNLLFTSEIALRALVYAESLPAGVGASEAMAELSDCVERMRLREFFDFGSRLDDAIAKAGHAADVDSLQRASETMRTQWQTQLLPKLLPVLHEYGRVALLIDNLDKTWEKGVDFENLSRFLLAMLVSAGGVAKEFIKQQPKQSRVSFTSTVFLRTDIYDVMARFAREPDKIGPRKIHWQDEELLIRVLEDRYLAYRKSGDSAPANELWNRVFCSEVRSMPTRDYILWRALQRPRDIIAFSNGAVTTAVNRKHNQVQPSDFHTAEMNYSQFAVEALLVESLAQGFDLEEILFGFAGLDSTISHEDLTVVLADVGDPQAVIWWLIRTGFLGVEARDGRFTHAEGESEARMKLGTARRLAERLDRPMQYRIHPAYRPYLDMRDDDIHHAAD